MLVSEHGVVKLADFGCSKVLESMHESSALERSLAVIKGTVPFMAPEGACRARVRCGDSHARAAVVRQTSHGKAADIWSVAATVVEMARGSPPYSEFSNQVID